MDVNQFESLNVTSPPVPASLPLNCCILSKNAGFFSVTVNDSQQDCAMQLLKATGLPNCDRPFASFSQRVQPPLSTLVSFLGALVIEPSSLSDLGVFRPKLGVLDHQNTLAENQNRSYVICERHVF